VEGLEIAGGNVVHKLTSRADNTLDLKVDSVPARLSEITDGTRFWGYCSLARGWVGTDEHSETGRYNLDFAVTGPDKGVSNGVRP